VLQMIPSDQKTPTPPESSGFQVKLKGASLWDLVQMECLAFSRRVVRITTTDDVGFLFFSGGQIVHAKTRAYEGEEAAMAILSWAEGSFEVCEAQWPPRDSISCTWQSLVMRAAQSRDESVSNVLNLVAFPKLNPGADVDSPGGASRAEATQTMNPDIEAIVRLSTDGSLVEAGGDTAEDLQAVACYVSQLGTLIGESLGMDGFHSIETESKESRLLIHMTPNGMIEGVRAKAGVTSNRLHELLNIKR